MLNRFGLPDRMYLSNTLTKSANCFLIIYDISLHLQFLSRIIPQCQGYKLNEQLV